ncbi:MULTISPECIES: hypothetical protein [Clostridium]|uniref:hypothetical protein n=1 Tax=Clostridium TaxID=1485 RepID=UPI00069D1271|nr:MULTISPECIES: hypothetical protein [Clostridium]KOF55991.1 hypothetical protein AGR56_03105 [Clostridium sp. DMHC 10]MCD2345406.1 hypothetical protein [Clostridium guangxiense]
MKNEKLNRLLKRRLRSKKDDQEITYEDILAMVIAGFQVFMPIFIMIGLILFIVLVFISKIWLK